MENIKKNNIGIYLQCDFTPEEKAKMIRNYNLNKENSEKNTEILIMINGVKKEFNFLDFSI